MSATDYLIESIVRPDAFEAPGTGRMPNVANMLSDTSVRHVATLLAALGGTPDYEAIATADIDALRPPQAAAHRAVDIEAAERGKRIFLGEGKCSRCHTLKRTTESGLIAPAVRYMAMHDPQFLRASIEDPDKVIADTYRQHAVVTNDGVVHNGRIMRRDKDRLVLLTVDSDGNMKPLTIPLKDVATGEDGQRQIVATSVSLMPRPSLTSSQIDDLVAFLSSATDKDQSY